MNRPDHRPDEGDRSPEEHDRRHEQDGHEAAGRERGDTRGTPRAAPDLEAEAQAIDRELSLQYGRVIDRWAWASRVPDGLFDNFLGWLPGVRQRRAIWEHGQRLWAERMAPERWT